MRNRYVTMAWLRAIQLSPWNDESSPIYGLHIQNQSEPKYWVPRTPSAYSGGSQPHSPRSVLRDHVLCVYLKEVIAILRPVWRSNVTICLFTVSVNAAATSSKQLILQAADSTKQRQFHPILHALSFASTLTHVRFDRTLHRLPNAVADLHDFG